jgi:hypothetical protein
LLSEESGKNTIWNICDNTWNLLQQHSRLLLEESGKNTIWNICANTGIVGILLCRRRRVWRFYIRNIQVIQNK